MEKYNTIWDKVSIDVKKEFDCKPVYNKTFLKTKIKSGDVEVEKHKFDHYKSPIFLEDVDIENV